MTPFCNITVKTMSFKHAEVSKTFSIKFSVTTIPDCHNLLLLCQISSPCYLSWNLRTQFFKKDIRKLIKNRAKNITPVYFSTKRGRLLLSPDVKLLILACITVTFNSIAELTRCYNDSYLRNLSVEEEKVIWKSSLGIPKLFLSALQTD